MVEHPKRYGIDSTLLSLFDRQQVDSFAGTDLGRHTIQALRDDTFIIAVKKETLLKTMKGQSVSNAATGNMAELNKEDEDDDMDELDAQDQDEQTLPSTLVERSSLLDRSLVRKGFCKFWEDA